MSEALIELDEGAGKLQRRHLSYQAELVSLLAVALDSHWAHAPGARSDLAQQVREARIRAYEDMSGQDSPVWAGMDRVMGMAEEDAALRVPEDYRAQLHEAMDAQSAHLQQQVLQALRMDEDATLTAFGNVQKRALLLQTQGMHAKVAFNLCKRGVLRQLSFTRPDNAGRAWKTSVFVRTATRAALLQVYLDTFYLALLAHGITLAQLHDSEGRRIEFGLLDDEAIRERYWHPNTHSLPERIQE
jgi:hypothetical protein